MKAISYKSLVFGLALAGNLTTAVAQSSDFTYQGWLADGGTPANGLYDLRFVLCDAEVGGTRLRTNQSPCVEVTNGLFTATLNFGAATFSGAPRWLEIGVRPKGDAASHAVLTPRQPITATPYAIQAANAASANALLGPLPGDQLAGTYAGPLTFNNPANRFTGDGAGLNNVNAGLLGGLSAAAFWKLGGNAGTGPANFLGTTDNQPLEFRVNGERALRLVPAPNGLANVIAGTGFNQVGAGVFGATIAGGSAHMIGSNSYSAVIAGGDHNTIGSGSDRSVIGGGGGNNIDSDGPYSVVSGGNGNSIAARATTSVISGGSDNYVESGATSAFVGGGYANGVGVDAGFSVIGGGTINRISANAELSAIGGGQQNAIESNSPSSTISGGAINRIQADAGGSAIGGGFYNSIQAKSVGAAIAGGAGNQVGTNVLFGVISGGSTNWIGAGAARSVISGGNGNFIGTNAASSVITGGDGNVVHGDSIYSVVNGGELNAVQNSASYSVIAGGGENHIGTYADGSAIGGGFANAIGEQAYLSIIGGGQLNTLGRFAFLSVIGGGDNNRVQSDSTYAVISGGLLNTIGTNAAGSTIGGGHRNTIQSNAASSVISGGGNNTIERDARGSVIDGGGDNTVGFGAILGVIGGGSSNAVASAFATVPGGHRNTAGGEYSFAAGRRAKANDDGAFVWADGQDADFVSTAANQFAVRANGGVRLETSGAGLTVDGQSLFAGGQVAPNTVSSASIINGAITASDVNAPSFATVFWKADGNAGTTPGTHFLGTTDGQPLEFKVNGARVLRLEPTRSVEGPNLIGGFSGNYADEDVVGATIGGGGQEDAGPNQISGDYGTIGGGFANRILPDAYWSTIGGGVINTISSTAPASAIGGGGWNTIGALAQSSAIGGGAYNTVGSNALFGVISGGYFNDIGPSAGLSAIGGGERNTNGAFGSAIGGGFRNTVQPNAGGSTIGGGSNNTIQGDSYSGTIGGGVSNIIGYEAAFSTISGGGNNGIHGGAGGSTISGGYGNSVLGGATASIGGGTGNVIEDVYGGTIPGGKDNRVYGSYGFAAGHRAKANHVGSFVWGDSTDADIASTTANSWTVRASGGTRFFSDSGAGVGVELAAGGNAWSAMSDRNVKENFQPVDARAVLEKVSRLPVTQWNLKSQPAGVRHLGPMAQDFAAAFGLGEDDRHISTSDADGVALVAIQGLNQMVEEGAKTKDARIQALEKELAELKSLVQTLVQKGGNQ